MNGSSHNPWAKRFETLLDPAVIKRRAAVDVPALDGLSALPVEQAVSELERALETVFYPTAQCVSVLQRLVGVAHAHCAMAYSDPACFLSGVYAKEAPLPQFVPPICLTGLAGTGKSQLIKAFDRIQEPERDIQIDEMHSAFVIRGPWLPVIQARSDPGDVLGSLCGMTGKPSALVKVCRKLAFRDGVPFVIPDEFQFATGSNSANARVTQMLFSLGYIGIPFLFAANYSLLRRLLKRPEEDQQRLLADPIVIVPDPWDSEDWQMTLEAQRGVAPSFLRFDSKADALDIHLYTAGRKRAVKHLLVTAFRAERSRNGVVTMGAIRHAYHSQAYAQFRAETEILNSQAVSNKPDKKRKDLWCPIPLPAGQVVQYLGAATKAREDRVAEEALKGGLTEAEREAVAAIEKGLKKSKKKPASVTPLKKKDQPTGDDLKQNANWLKDNL